MPRVESKKRILLTRNVKRLIDRIEEGIVPVKIVEVYAFGSFLRFKAEPGDIDLVLFYREEPVFDEKVELFRQFIIKQSETKEGRELLKKLTDDEVLAKELENAVFPGLPVSIWLRHIKATGPMKTYIQYNFNRSDITKKILKEKLRYIQIAYVENINEKEKVLSWFSAQMFKLIWSDNKRDLDDNLKDLQDVQLEATLSEMKNFSIQIERYKSYYYVLLHVIKQVINEIQFNKIIPEKETLVKLVKEYGVKIGILEGYMNWIINQIKWMQHINEPSLQEPVTNLDIDKAIENAKNSVNHDYELGDLCETMRNDINVYRSKCTVARHLLHQLIDSSNGYWVPPIEERIDISALRALLHVPFYEASDEIKREVLTDLNLNDTNRRIILIERLGSKPDYKLADDDEELKKLTKLSRISKTEKEHAKYIRPILRKVFPKNIGRYVALDIHINEHDGLVLNKLNIDIKYEGEKIENFINIIKDSGFDVSDKYENFCIADLSIDISHLNGDKKEIKKLVKDSLSYFNEYKYKQLLKI